MKTYFDDIQFLTRIEPALHAGPDVEHPIASSSAIVGGIEAILLWPENLDKLEKGYSSLEKKLSSEGFTSKAPADVVARERERQEQLGSELRTLRERLGKLRA